MEYGSPFNKPNITLHVYPGSWSRLQDNSPFIIESIEFILDYIKTSLNFSIPDNIKLNVFNVGAQIVNGINIYIEFRIIGPQNLDIQAIVNRQAIRIHNKDISENNGYTIHKIYITSKKIF